MLVPRCWLQAQLRAWTLIPTASGAWDASLKVSVLHAVHGLSGGPGVICFLCIVSEACARLYTKALPPHTPLFTQIISQSPQCCTLLIAFTA